MTALFLALLACSGSDAPSAPIQPSSGDSDSMGDGDDPSPIGPEVVQVETIDGIQLEGDLYGQESADGAAGVCLLHMIPPSNDRTGWPVDFIELLQGQGWGVFAIDRRGAGGSAGVAADAYEGPGGTYDAEACVRTLVETGFGPIAVIGASNGTTSMIDYAVWAEEETGRTPVAAMGFMTGGSYTEAQTAMGAVPAVPALFTYSVAEDDWSEDQQGLHDDVWSFEEYIDGGHGTRMFEARPNVRQDLVAFLASTL